MVDFLFRYFFLYGGYGDDRSDIHVSILVVKQTMLHPFGSFFFVLPPIATKSWRRRGANLFYRKNKALM